MVLVFNIIAILLVGVVFFYKLRTYRLVRSRAFFIISAAVFYMWLVHVFMAVFCIREVAHYWTVVSLPFWILMAIGSVVLFRDLDSFLRKRGLDEED